MKKFVKGDCTVILEGDAMEVVKFLESVGFVPDILEEPAE